MHALDRRSLLLALAFALAGGAVRADEDDDHDEARRALEEGRVRPLAEIRARVAATLGGEIVGIELERKDGRYVYEFKLVHGGRLSEVMVDGLTGEILGEED